jgi:hypothetical protein
MGKMNQKEAVFQAVCSVTGFKGEGVCTPSKEQRAMINQIIIEGFVSGNIELDRQYDESGLKSYTSGLVSNWLRKDKRLNGGTQYVAKNPGSRAGSSDPSLKAMRALLSTLTDEADRAEVQGLIDAKVAEINATKNTKTIDFSALPAELREKFGK